MKLHTCGGPFCIHLDTKYANFQEKIFAEISEKIHLLIALSQGIYKDILLDTYKSNESNDER